MAARPTSGTVPVAYQYAYASRLPGEPAFNEATTPATLHVHPSGPRMARVGLKVFF